MPPTLLDALQSLAPQAAADCSRALAAGAVQQGAHRSAAAFTLAGRVRARAQALDGACRDEASAEARSAALELRFRTATELLVAAARRARATLDAALPGGPAPQRAVQILDEGLARWLDPYAADAAGAEPPDAWAEQGATDMRERAAAKAREILASHYPSYISAEADARIRARFPIRLPEERMRAG